jgi:hypothetical protein
MTRYLLDVASYQGRLAVGDVVRAGFTAVNLKTSHGLGQKTVHPDIAGWVARAKSAQLGLATFHYLTADAAGAAQAIYAYERLTALGLLPGTAHVVDVESDPVPTLAAVREYLTTMTALLGRPVMLYTGDWWWTARSGWNVSDLAPYLHAAPNRGYLSSYPGDTSTDWNAGYGGWSVLSAMQYAVGPLSYPDGTRGSIDVSKSAIRDPAVWRDLTQGRPGLTVAPASLLAARQFYIDTLAKAGFRINPLSVGIVGDDPHAQTGSSYHLGKSALRADSYTIVESPRDRAGLSEAAAALDLGMFTITVGGKRHDLRSFSLWLVAQCKANTADTADIREVIYSPDGVTVKRWDRLGKRSTGDASHLTHTHESWFRDSEARDKTAHLKRYFTEIGVLEDDVPLATDMITLTKDTAAVLGKNEGDKVSAASLLQLAVILASRSGSQVWNYPLEDPTSTTTPKGTKQAGTYQRYLDVVARAAAGEAVNTVKAIVGDGGADPEAIAAAVAGLLGPQIDAATARLSEVVTDPVTPEEAKRILLDALAEAFGRPGV